MTTPENDLPQISTPVFEVTALPSSTPSVAPTIQEPTSTATGTATPTPILISEANWTDLSVEGILGLGQLRNGIVTSDQQYMVVGTTHGYVIVDLNTKEVILQKIILEPIGPIALLPDENWVFAAIKNLGNPRLVIWDLFSGEIVYELTGFKGMIAYVNIELYPLVITSGWDGTTIWDSRDWTVVKKIGGLDGPLIVSPDGKFLIGQDSSSFTPGLAFVPIEGSETRPTLSGGGKWVAESIALVDSLVSVFQDGTVRFWTAPNLTHLEWNLIRNVGEFGSCGEVSYETYCGANVALSPDSQFLHVSRNSNLRDESGGPAFEGVLARFTTSGELVWQISAPRGTLSVSPDGLTLYLIASSKGNIHLYDAQTGAELITLDISMSSDQCLVAQHALQIIEGAWGHQPETRTTGRARWYSVDLLSPDQRNTLSKLDIDDFESYQIVEYVTSENGGKFGLFLRDVFDNKLDVIVAGSINGNIAVQSSSVEMPSYHLAAFALSPDGTYLSAVTDSRNADKFELLTWNIDTGEPQTPIALNRDWGFITSVEYLNESQVIIADSTGYLRLFDVHSGAQIDWFLGVRLFDGAQHIFLKNDGGQLALSYCLGSGFGGDDIVGNYIIVLLSVDN